MRRILARRGRALTEVEDAWQTIAPSAIAFSDNAPTPRAMSQNEIDGTAQAFADAAARADAASVDVLEIHCAHGYLLHEFLSPLSNQRDDDYGGSLANRARLPLAVVRAVRAVWPDNKPLFVRISASDFEDGGWTSGDSVELADWLRAEGIDLIDCSGGGNTPNPNIPIGPGYQTGFAARIRREANIATGAVGLTTDPMQAEHIVRSGQADCVLMAREMLRDPYFALRAGVELHGDHGDLWPVQYQRAAG